MKLTIDDTGIHTKLIITNGSKTLLTKQGKSIKSLLKFVFNGTKKENVKESIMELQSIHKFMVNAKTTIDIKGD